MRELLFANLDSINIESKNADSINLARCVKILLRLYIESKFIKYVRN